MSRVGKMPIKLPPNVNVQIGEDNHVVVEAGGKRLERTMPAEIKL
jgi:hypothetical protein